MDSNATAVVPGGGRELAARLAGVRAELALIARAVHDRVLDELDAEVLPELAETAFAAADAATAVATAATGRVDATGVLRSRGIIATATWLRAGTGMGRREARAVVARSLDLQRPELDPTRVAWLSGRVRGSQVREVALGLRACARHARANPAALELIWGQGQDLLLQVAATGGDADQVAAAGRRLLSVVFPDGVGQEQIDSYDAQSLSIVEVGGQFVLRGSLDTVAGAALILALDRMVDGWFRDGTLPALPVLDPVTGLLDVEATLAAAGTDAQQLRRGRREQYRAHALNQLVARWLDGGGAGTHHGGARAHLNLHVQLADLLAGAGAGELDVAGHDAVVPVPVATIARIGCDADLTVIVEHALATAGAEPHLVPADGDLLSTLAARLRADAREVLWLGRTRRHVTARQWRYLVARDRHCQFPGCHVDPSRCRPHHVNYWWEHQGPTDVDNLLLLCETHHRLVHEGGWAITTDDTYPAGSSRHWVIQPPRRRIQRESRAA